MRAEYGGIRMAGPILRLLQVPQDIYGMMRGYLWIIFAALSLRLSIISMRRCCVRWEIR